MLGNQKIVEFYNCNPDVLNNVQLLEQEIVKIVQEANATVIKHYFHQFSPYGVSGVIVISESHIAIHTFPEYNYASVDIYTCGDKVDLEYIFHNIKFLLQSKNFYNIKLERGSQFNFIKGEKNE